ncbi:hypothetical protein PMIN01_03493 [Paraphaeosphaeria minitans]|uniref:Uncharacterized protein n=1 Tax=Paraphaeosphaeria minitans TaxID=565426 RepID=A0A9P6GNH5_9PLEO|nr:hypothetical protein PMIN01_03493 [Paraphaeosphaeria minitans]
MRARAGYRGAVDGTIQGACTQQGKADETREKQGNERRTKGSTPFRTKQQQTLSLTLYSESLACGTAWTSSTVEERLGQVPKVGRRGIWDDDDDDDDDDVMMVVVMVKVMVSPASQPARQPARPQASAGPGTGANRISTDVVWPEQEASRARQRDKALRPYKDHNLQGVNGQGWAGMGKRFGEVNCTIGGWVLGGSS